MRPSVAQVEAEVRGLHGLGVEALRERWRGLYGAPPALRSADQLRRLLAWRLQADAFGGLDAETRQAVLRQGVKRRGPVLEPGCRLAREWQGVRHEAEIIDGGVRYAGRTFTSLSEVAREITGTRWNGPRFFGLREQARVGS